MVHSHDLKFSGEPDSRIHAICDHVIHLVFVVVHIPNVDRMESLFLDPLVLNSHEILFLYGP